MLHTILVAEDDITINEVVSEYLKDAGFLVVSFMDGQEVKNYLMEHKKVDLFILDIMLPNVSGLELLKIIRNSESDKETPVMMFTALGDEYTQLLSFEGLADDYVTKPFSPKILVKRVEALLRRTSEPTHLLKIGSISLSLDGYEAFENECPLSLTLKEFELLKILIQNCNKVLSRQQLLNLVWGYDYFGDERIVDVHIKNLRKKLTENIITTVKGVGYKIEANKKDEA